MRKPKVGDTTAVHKVLTQYGFGPTAGGGTQQKPMEERQQPSLEEEKHNRERMPELTLPAALLARESGCGRAELSGSSQAHN
jgi:hypothetical protein